MESSPLELYESAYRLHYVEQKLVDACRLYEAIIKQFPDSSECGYAAIQLQKIAAQEVARSVHGKTGHRAGLLFVLVFLNMAALAGGGFLLIDHLKRIEARLQGLSAASRAIGKLLIDEEEGALAALEQGKKVTGHEAALFSLAADIHESNNRFDQAIAEYEQMRQLNPGMPIPQEDIGRIEMKTEAAKRRKKVRTTVAPPETINTPQEVEARLSGNKPAAGKRLIRRSPKSHLIVNQDSISFF